MQALLNRQNLGRGLAVLALALAIYGAYLLTFMSGLPSNEPLPRDTGALLLLFSIPLFWGSLALHPQELHPFEVVIRDEAPLKWFHWTAVVVGVLAIFAFAELNGAAFRNILNLRNILPNAESFQLALLCSGSLSLAWGLSGGFRWSSAGRILDCWNDFSREQWLEIAGVIAVTLLALVVRATNLERAIPAFVDEVSFTAPLPAFDFNDEMYLAQPINTVAAFPRLYIYLEYLSIKVFGQDLSAFRLPSAIFGALTAPALYWLCKHLFRRRDLAFIAALLMATLPVHIQFSRLGMNNPGDPFFGVLGFALLARGMRYGGRANYALGGISLGWAQYFHEAGRLAFPVLGIMWLIWVAAYSFWRTRQFSFRAPLVRNAVIAVVCLVIVGLPVYYTFRAAGYSLATRVEDVGLRSDYWKERQGLFEIIDGVRTRSAEALKRLFHQPELVLYYAGDTPYIPYVLTPFIALGFAFALWRFWQPPRTLVLMWAILPFAGIVILLAEIMSPRTTVFLPALVLFAALGIFYGLRSILGASPNLMRWVLIIVIAGLCIDQTVYYFSVHLPRFMKQTYNLQPWQQFIFQTRMLPRDPYIHVISEPKNDQSYLWQVVRFMTNYPEMRLETHDFSEITPDYLGTLDRDVTQVFIVQMTDPQINTLLREFFPALLGPYIDNEPDMTANWYAIYILPTTS